MTAASKRWKRILAVRAVQKRMAEVELSSCEAELRSLVNLSTRIAAIRDDNQPIMGAQDGLMLRSISELSARLDSAQLALVNPSQNAAHARDRQQRAVVTAMQRELAVEKIHASKVTQDAKRAEDRLTKLAIFRRSSGLGAKA